MTGEKPVVYVVDDDPSVGKALERLMRSAGFEARTFTSALEFLKAEDWRPRHVSSSISTCRV